MQPFEITFLIKSEAKKAGFDYCGISKAGFLEDEARRFEEWLHKGMHAGMGYMGKNMDKRLDPRLLVEGAKSVISLMVNYYPDEKQPEEVPQISKYAYGKDYHIVIKGKLKRLLERLREEAGDINGRGFVDSAPVLERAWAAKSGLGWIGRNTHLIRPGNGSFFFLAELIVDIELEYDSPISDYCGTCRKCIDACPTRAITENNVVDGSKCISYYTIELKKETIPTEMKGKFDSMVFGCDICQDVCPWNRFSTPHNESELQPDKELLGMTGRDWVEITEELFKERFHDSPLMRAGFKGMKRNLEFISS